MANNTQFNLVDLMPTILFKKLYALKFALFYVKADMTTPEGKSIDRYRRAALTSSTLIVARLVNVLTGLATIPITLNYLGADQFGVWMALTSFVAFLSFTDLGMGVGVQNALIKCNGNDDLENPKFIIGSGLFVLTGITSLLVLFALFILPLLPVDVWIKFQNPDSLSVLLPTAQVMFVGFALGLPLGLVQRVCDAYQRGYWGYGLLVLGRILAFLGVIIAAICRWPLPVLAGIYMITPFIVTGIGSFFVVNKMPWLVPHFSRESFKYVNTLFGTGILVLCCHLGYALLHSAPAIIIANQIDAASVTPFSVTQKMIGAVTILISPILQSFWGPIGEAAVRGDVDWINNASKNLLKILTVLILPVALVFVVFGQKIIGIWTANPNAIPSKELLILCLIGVLIGIFDQKFTLVLNAMNRFGIRAISMITFAFIAFFTVKVFGRKLTVEGIVFVYVFLGSVPVFLVNAAYSIFSIKSIEIKPNVLPPQLSEETRAVNP